MLQELSIFATDDEGRGASVWLFRRHEGTAWRVNVVPPQGGDARLYGVSGLSPVDPSLVMDKVGRRGVWGGAGLGAGRWRLQGRGQERQQGHGQ